MPQTIAALVERLPNDDWRLANPFTPEVDVANAELVRADRTVEQRCETLDHWLVRHQPCVFGRVAARIGSISYCILTDADLQRADEHIYAQIQSARANWKARAYSGKSSAFVIALLSPRLVSAGPSTELLDLAQRVCELYLIADEIRPNLIYTDSIELEVPLPEGRRSALSFDVGVNFFATAADRRWWHDHRIPGGIALSMNSVGHLVKSGQLRNALAGTSALVGYGPEEDQPKLESLGEALRWAMQTIASASAAVSGPATRLLPNTGSPNTTLPRCPIQLPQALRDKNHCEYAGWYHTDVTLPAEYFRADAERPSELTGHLLDFTYLFDDRLDNVAFRRIGQGVRVRGLSPTDVVISAAETEEAKRKRPRASGEPVDPSEQKN